MITEHAVGGWRAITVTSDHLSLTVLPDRGAEVHALVDRASGVDVLFHAPWGLAPPGAPAREGSDGHAFLEGYAGGWQELFPSAEGPCTYRGHDIGYHGEVAAIPWQVDADGPLSLVCTINCQTVPFRLERRLTLVADLAQLRVDERISNTGAEPWECTWGHHLVLGPPFVAAGARFEPAAGTIVTIPEMYEATARLEPGQRSPWPNAQLRAGGTVDLGEHARARIAQPRRHLPDRPLRRPAARHQPGPRARAAAGLGRRRLQVADRLDAVRRRRGDAAPRLLRARHRARGSRSGRWPTRPPSAMRSASRAVHRSRPPSP